MSKFVDKINDMDAKELRIGNKVYYSIGKQLTVYTIDAGRQIDTFIKCFEPILLTEEILLKCKGMFKSENQLSIDRFVLSFQPKYNFWYVLDSISLTYISKIEFLHEWLNLYFFLNGEELEINL